MRREKNIAEKQNDALLFWETLGPIIYRIVGVIVVVGLIAAGFAIKNAIKLHDERAALQQEKLLNTERETIAKKFIDSNEKYFGTITKQWSSGNFFYVESDKGEFTITFDDRTISTVFLENKAGQTVTLYEKK